MGFEDYENDKGENRLSFPFPLSWQWIATLVRSCMEVGRTQLENEIIHRRSQWMPKQPQKNLLIQKKTPKEFFRSFSSQTTFL